MRARLGLLAAVAAVIAGCGGTGGGGHVPAASAELPRGAAVAPRGAAAFVALDTDFASPQWRRGLALVRKFPGGRTALQKLFRRVDFRHEVEPAFGAEVDLVWLDFRNSGNDVVGLTRPKSNAKLKTLLAKGAGKATYTSGLHGWAIFAGSRALLDRFKHEARSGSLSDEHAFQDAVGRLDAHAAVRVYLRAKTVQAELDRAFERGGAPPGLSEEVATLDALAADASATTAGARFRGIVTVQHAIRPNAYTAQLPDDLPAGALLFFSFNHLDLALKKTLKIVSKQKPGFEQQLSQVESVADITLQHDIYPLLSHEGAVAVYPSRPIPTIVFALRLKDDARARRVLSRMITIAELGGSSSLRANSFLVRGIEVDELDFRGPPRTRVFAAVFDDKLAVVNDGPTMRTLIGGGGPKFSSDPAFRRVQRLARMPQRTLGFVYANLREGLPAAFQLDRRSGGVVTAADRANTKPLESALLYATRDADRYALTGFATIK